MFNKTLRSALSLLLVFCLLWGMSGNAIALAVGNPADKSLAEVDTKVYGTIDQMNAMIDGLEAFIDEMDDTLEKATAGADTDTKEDDGMLTAAKLSLAEARAKLDELTAVKGVNGALEDGDVTFANKKLAEAEADLADALRKLEGEELAKMKQTAKEKAQEEFDKLFAQKEQEAWDTFDAAVDSTIQEKRAELEATLNSHRATMNSQIAQKKAELETRLAAEKVTLDEKLAMAGADQAAIDAAHQTYEENAKAARDAFAAEEANIRAEFAANEQQAWNDFNDYVDSTGSDYVAQKRAELVQTIANAKVAAQAEFDAEFEVQYSAKLDEVYQFVADVVDVLDDAKAYVVEVNEAVAYFYEKVEEAEAELAKAYAMVAEAEEALAVARAAVEQARTLVGNVETTYTDLREAVANPTPSLHFIQETVNELQANYDAAWNALVDLDADFDTLIKEYEDLKAYKFATVTIDRDNIEEVTIHVKIIEIDLNCDGVIDPDTEVFGIKTEETLPEIDFSKYNQSFDEDDIPALPDLDELLDKALKEYEITYDVDIKDIQGLLDDVIAVGTTLNVALATAVPLVKKVVAKALDIAEETLGITYDFLKAHLSRDMHEKVYNWLYNNPAKVCELVKEFGVFGLDLLVQYGDYALNLLNDHFDLAVLAMKVTAGGAYLTVTLGAKALGYLGDRFDFLEDYKGKIADAARRLYAKYDDKAKDLIDVYVEYLDLKDRYHNATHADIDLSCVSKYVAIGDANAYVYSALLAEKLGVTAGSPVCIDDTSIQKVLDRLNADSSDLVGAELITVGFGNMVAIDAMVNVLADNSKGYDADWSVLTNKTVDELIYKSLAELEAELVERDLSKKYVTLVMDAAEAYAYQYALQQEAYIKLINKIQAVNPDAQIVIVGAYNEMEDVSVKLGSHEIEIGKYINPLVFAVNLQSLAEGFLNEKVIFVDAPDVDKNAGKQLFDLNNNPDKILDVLYDVSLQPSDEGFAYIVDQIHAGLNGTVAEHTGNNTLEGYVAATCTTPGYTGDTVCECGVTIATGTVIPATNHPNTITINAKAATCTEDGYTGDTFCTDCNQIIAFGTVIPAGHTAGAVTIENKVAATCTAEGSYDEVVYCTVCGVEISRVNVVDAKLPHTPGDVVIENEVPATCTAEGSHDEVVYCSVCGEELSRNTVVDPATGHTAGTPVVENRVEADCVNDGSYDLVTYCSVCNEELTREAKTIPALGHAWGEWNVVKPATATEAGLERRDCDRCDAFETRPIAPTGSEDPDEPIDPENPEDVCKHQYGCWYLYKMPTCTEEGELRRDCKLCGEYDSIILPALNTIDFDFGYRDEIMDLLRDLYNKLGDKLFEIVEDATHADFNFNCDSHYVAIGDGTAAAGGYADVLAEMLGLTHRLDNLAQNGMTVSDAIDMVGKESAVIGQADLITLGFSNLAASMDLLNVLNGDQYTDWSDAVGEKIAKAIDKALAELKQQLVQEGYDAESVEMILDGASAYAYAYASRAILYPALVNAIRDVNEDALIVIVGTYNDLEGVVLDVNGREVNISKYTKFLVYAANLENLLQAIHGDDVIYVHAPEVETIFEEYNYGKLNNLGYLMSMIAGEMLPSENGNAYIAQKIYEALNNPGKAEHVPGETVIENEFDADCVNNGGYDEVVYCEICGEELSRNFVEIEATGHVFGCWELHKLPTWSEDGELRRYCQVCDYYESFILPALCKPDFDFDFGYRDDIMDMLRKLYDILGDKLFDLVEDATHADYTIFHDSLYVAIGDSTGVSESYVDKLAELLEIPHMMENLSQENLTISGAIDLVGKEADLISKADLITVGFSNIAASIDMLKTINGEQTADWSAAVGETAAKAIAKSLSELKDQLVAEGYDEETVSMILDAANAYAYAYAARIMLYPSLVNEIREVNADALIVLVGTYNDLEGVVVELNGREVNIGEYAKHLIFAANLESLLQAIHGENIIYVHAPDVETVFEEKNEDLNNLGYLMSVLGGEMLPTEAGNAYIAQKIYDALTVRYAIWGDVNGDRKVNCRDARLILMYAAGLITEDDLDLTWADVNGDGKVNSRDARLILRLRAGLIDHFPVCRLSEE